MNSREVKEYLSHHLVPQLLESLLTGLLYHCPDNPVSFLHGCLIRTRQLGGPEAITWDTFIHLDRDELRPGPPRTSTSPTESKEEDTKTGSSEVWSQLSIDSDSDMTESSGLLQEVSILPPQRPRPVIIFIIGGPGSGKGSQTARLVRCFCLRAVSLDDLLRKQLLSHASPSRKWEVISEMMSHRELATQEKTISELRRQLIGQREVRGVVVDGFPQDVHQALSFQEQIGSPDLVMLQLCSNETVAGQYCE
ncbi:adenylate kinase isoenzyme 5-like [Seriola dumerili]|uniref:adenylate kinase isoenzyme 5-like n=1 Tax=Seriola dumerili TaxID=41447 RepID=UPI000BBEBA15|nr:adenylate kinase isoenzyme 5-like [Seriola dumerili]